jgi:hypothetical protein
MARAHVSEDERKDFYMYIDELHNFSTDTFASLLSESRKYRLCLTLSHQYSTQLREEVRDAVFGNVGTVIAFRVGEADASLLELEFGESYAASHFTELENFEVCVKLLSNGKHNYPFSGKTFPPMDLYCGRRENIRKRSREKYGTPRHIVEAKIARKAVSSFLCTSRGLTMLVHGPRPWLTSFKTRRRADRLRLASCSSMTPDLLSIGSATVRARAWHNGDVLRQ